MPSSCAAPAKLAGSLPNSRSVRRHDTAPRSRFAAAQQTSCRRSG
ncbi:hypothetical protein [Azospirillum endophyticum]